jgi:type I restriction enzyme, S subunit
MKASPPVMLDEDERGHSYPPVNELKSSPSDWSISELGEVAEFKNGINFTKTEKGEHGVPTLDVRNMYGRGVTVDCTNLYRVSKRIGNDHLLRTGDLLFVRSSLKQEGIGWTSLFIDGAEPTSFCGFIIRARIRSGAPIDPLFLAYFCRSSDARNRLVAGSGKVAITNISQDVLARLPIPVPPLPEQKKIAAVLGVVQQAMEQQERLLALTAELKKTLLHQLFTTGLRHEPQKPTDIGPVPESWGETTLGALACKPHGFLQTGPFGSQLHKHDYQDEGVGVVNPTHLWGNKINHEDVPRVSPEVAARLDRHLLEPGDILFARRGEIGRHGMVTESERGWLCGTGCFLARVRQPHIDNRFLSYLISTRGAIAWLNSHAAGAIMPNLNNTVLRSMPVFFPPHEEQVEIADTLDATEKKFSIHQRKHANLAAFFRTLLHQLMTAAIRVHDLDLPELERAAAA